MAGRSDSVPLPALLSAALVAFIIEFDNAAEQRMAHSTTQGGRGGGPWLTSQVFWANALQYLSAGEGLSVTELRSRARTERQNLEGLRRWGYVTLGDGPDPVVTLRRGGQRAGEVWEGLAAEIEVRWQERFGTDAVDTLRHCLLEVLSRVELALPDSLPLIFPAKLGRVETCAVAPPPSVDELGKKDLSVLLARALQSFALEVERGSKASLAMCSNTLRVLDKGGIRLRDLPRLSGVSKEATAMVTNFYVRAGQAALEPDPSASRGQVLRITSRGVTLRSAMAERVAETERHWGTTHGTPLGPLRDALGAIVGQGLGRDVSPLFEGLAPPEGGWRARQPEPATLPHFPLPLHRGGYPDGS